MIPISVIVLTKNEEKIIGRCISSINWADEILVMDACSSDRTREVAKASGAVVHIQEWLGWVPQRQCAIALAQNDWIFVLEADEIVTHCLATSIQAVMSVKPDPKDGFSVDRRDELFGRLLPNMKRNKMRATFIRLFNRKHSHYDPNMAVHERVICQGNTVLLSGLLLHWRNVAFLEQQRKAVDYAALEADLLDKEGVRPGPLRLVSRPVLRFIWTYVLRHGYRAGVPGLIYALMAAQGEFLRNVTLWERQNTLPCADPPEELYHGPKLVNYLGDSPRGGVMLDIESDRGESL